MKIICVARNYAQHAKELNNPLPDEPVIFLKPDSALLTNKQPFFLPDFSKEMHYEGELVLRISRQGKNIQETFAHKYYDHITVGIDFTARDLQNKLKDKGWPWEIAKAFDQSAVVGEFIPLKNFKNKDEINFQLTLNDKTVQVGFIKDMIFSIDYLISYVSKFFTLKMGDLIFTGTPVGVGTVNIGDKLEGFLMNKKTFSIKVK